VYKPYATARTELQLGCRRRYLDVIEMTLRRLMTDSRWHLSGYLDRRSVTGGRCSLIVRVPAPLSVNITLHSLVGAGVSSERDQQGAGSSPARAPRSCPLELLVEDGSRRHTGHKYARKFTRNTPEIPQDLTPSQQSLVPTPSAPAAQRLSVAWQPDSTLFHHHNDDSRRCSG